MDICHHTSLRNISEIIADRNLECVPLVIHKFSHITDSPLVLPSYHITAGMGVGHSESDTILPTMKTVVGKQIDL